MIHQISNKLFSNSLGKLEADEAPLALVYHYFGKLVQHYKDDKIVQEKIEERWKFIENDCMGLAYLLTPKFAASGYFMGNDKLKFIQCLKLFTDPRNPELSSAATSELLKFLEEMSNLDDGQKQFMAEISASQYWNIVGKEKFPSLFTFAKSLSAMICSSASSERVWSIYGFIHNKLRNRLASGTVDKLVFLYVNCGMYDTDKEDYIFEDGFMANQNDFESFE